VCCDDVERLPQWNAVTCKPSHYTPYQGGEDFDMPAPYTASDIAKWILAGVDRDSGDSITHLKLQKLIYYVQAWSLALRDKPLFEEDMQAWAHGPVAESVFHEYRDYGFEAIPAPKIVPEILDEDAEHIAEVIEVYSEHSAKVLERMTHNEQPWLEARKNLPPEARSKTPIDKNTMRDFYRSAYQEADGEEE
jgi:uncharacterized phage-associated protein